MTDEAKREERILRMTTAKIYPLLIRMAIPSMVGMMVSTVYGMTDTYFVGKLNDATLTASVGVVFTFISIVQAIGFWLGYGAGNHASRMIGNKETEQAEEMAATGGNASFRDDGLFANYGLRFAVSFDLQRDLQ